MTPITVTTEVKAPLETVWACFTKPEHIVNWNFASPDWHSPAANNDLREGGSFSYTMAARDGSMSFEFSGSYTRVNPPNSLAFKLDDDRMVYLEFEDVNGIVKVTETFDPEQMNPIDLQKMGWQAILDNFKKYTESI